MALVNEAGEVLASVGAPKEIDGLARLAGPWVRGEPCSDVFDRVTAGTDLVARGIQAQDETLYFAALGDRVRRLPDAARSVARILAESN
jgi:hypothetical protein